MGRAMPVTYRRLPVLSLVAVVGVKPALGKRMKSFGFLSPLLTCDGVGGNGGGWYASEGFGEVGSWGRCDGDAAEMRRRCDGDVERCVWRSWEIAHLLVRLGCLL